MNGATSSSFQFWLWTTAFVLIPIPPSFHVSLDEGLYCIGRLYNSISLLVRPISLLLLIGLCASCQVVVPPMPRLPSAVTPYTAVAHPSGPLGHVLFLLPTLVDFGRRRHSSTAETTATVSRIPSAQLACCVSYITRNVHCVL